MAVFGKSILPKPIQDKALRAELLAELRRLGTDIRKDFEATTATWEGPKPTFVVQQSLAQGRSALFVGPKGTGGVGEKKYRWVSDGTRPHLIKAGILTGRSAKKTLRFPGTFRAKTAPGLLGSRPGGSSGAPVFAKVVHHPGTKARRYDFYVMKKWTGPYARRMRAAMGRAAAASGHRYP